MHLLVWYLDISEERTLQGQAAVDVTIACWSLAEGETKSGEQQPGSTFPDVAGARPCCRIPSQSAYNGPALNIFNIRPSSWWWGAGRGVGITLIQYLSGICSTFHGQFVSQVWTINWNTHSCLLSNPSSYSSWRWVGLKFVWKLHFKSSLSLRFAGDSKTSRNVVPNVWPLSAWSAFKESCVKL